MPDNQTPDEWLRLPSVVNNPAPRGTGLFLASSESGEKAISEGIVYDDFVGMCVQNNYFVFKWVPYEIASPEEINQIQCGGDRCAKSCIKSACLCNTAIGRCR